MFEAIVEANMTRQVISLILGAAFSLPLAILRALASTGLSIIEMQRVLPARALLVVPDLVACLVLAPVVALLLAILLPRLANRLFVFTAALAYLLGMTIAAVDAGEFSVRTVFTELGFAVAFVGAWEFARRFVKPASNR